MAWRESDCLAPLRSALLAANPDANVWDDASELRRIAMTLHRWHEGECGLGDDYKSTCITRGFKKNGEFTYDEDNGKPFWEVHFHRGESKTQYWSMPDRERGALKRLAKIMARYPQLRSYVQGDPRGAPLYILPEGKEYPSGVAVYQ